MNYLKVLGILCVVLSGTVSADLRLIETEIDPEIIRDTIIGCYTKGESGEGNYDKLVEYAHHVGGDTGEVMAIVQAVCGDAILRAKSLDIPLIVLPPGRLL